MCFSVTTQPATLQCPALSRMASRGRETFFGNDGAMTTPLYPANAHSCRNANAPNAPVSRKRARRVTRTRPTHPGNAGAAAGDANAISRHAFAIRARHLRATPWGGYPTAATARGSRNSIIGLRAAYGLRPPRPPGGAAVLRA